MPPQSYCGDVTTVEHVSTESRLRLAAGGLWLLPVYGLLLAVSTLTHEPDHAVDFEAWSRYVTTDVFVVSHVVASIIGAGLGLVGAAAALVFLVRGPAVNTASVALALTILGNVLFIGLFAAAAYTQPAIGRAFLAGQEGAVAWYDDVYGTPLLVSLALGAPAFIAGAILLGRAVARTSPALVWAGWVYGVSLVVFLVAAFTVQVVQPLAGVTAAVAAVVIALRLPSAVR